MALLVLRLALLGVLAAAADDVPVVWSGGRASLPCTPPGAGRFATRPPPPPLETDEDPRPKAKPYAWLHEGKLVSGQRIASNGSLEVNRRRDNEGHYQCSIKYHRGRVLGYPMQLKYASIEHQFSVSPEDTTVQAGHPAVFRCEVRSLPPAEVSWLKDGEPVLDDERHHKLPNQLLILDVTEEDEGSYSCIATNKILNKSRSSAGAQLTVRAPVDALAPSPLALQVDSAPAIPKGGKLVLACPMALSPPFEMIWQYTPPGGRTAELAATEQVLVLSRMEVDDAGVYTCRVDGQGDVIRTFNVTITEPPVVVNPPAPKEATRASTVRFNCTATGRPQPVITWYKDGEKLDFYGRARVLKSYDESNGSGDRMQLVVSGITSEDAGIYQCFASNGAGVASSWAELNVTGVTAARPENVSCRPVGVRAVTLRWDHPDHKNVVAYTIQVTPAVSDVGPIQGANVTVKVAEPFTPHGFQVRAFATSNSKSGASDYSDAVYCEGQGAPIQLSKLPNKKVLVSWKPFAAQTNGVLEWLIQLRPEDNPLEVRNHTLPAQTHNYTVDVSSGHYSVRVLGTKTRPWLHQDLSLLPWSSTAEARDLDHGDFYATPTDLAVSDLTTSSFTITWRCDEADAPRALYTFVVCLKNVASDNYSCRETFTKSYSVEGLDGDTQYFVKVKARAASKARDGQYTAPLLVRTLKPAPSRFANVKPVYLNGTTALLRWGGPARANYTVRLLLALSLPLEDWPAQLVVGPEVYITLNPVNNTYVMVSTTNEPVVNSNIFVLHSQHSDELVKELAKNEKDVDPEPMEVQDVHHEYTSGGLRVRWSGPPGARYRVRFSQDLVSEMEAWRSEYVDRPTVLLTGLDNSVSTHVQVHLVRPEGPKPRPDAPVYTLPPAPRASSSVYLGIGVGVGLCLLCVLLVAAFCIWRRRKRQQSPARARRRIISSRASNEEEGSEMTSVGARLANGRAPRGAGEPLLNGHVHITENPSVSKTPNGKTRKSRSRLEAAAFDVSRFEEADTTAETTLEADLSAAYDYLDTSRRPDDSSRSSPRAISADNSFSKLPDDNMNSELTRSTDYVQKDNSKAQPTLQPNG